MSTFKAALVEALAEGGATFGADGPGIPGIILTHDASPGLGDLRIRSSPDVTQGDANMLGRARRGMPIFVTGGKAPGKGHPQGFFPVVVPQAFATGDANRSIGQVTGFVAADLVQLPAAPPAPSPAPAPSPPAAPVGPAGPGKLPPPPPPPKDGPSLGMIAAGILGGIAVLAVGAKAVGKKKG